jgi:16S rRNA (uracil1498-N3)-methyltransferase
MIRIFATWQDRVVLTPKDEHHLVQVLRVRVGEKLELLMKDGVYSAKVLSMKPLEIHRQEKLVSNHELPFSLTLIYPVIKGEKMDWVVQKATEIGVTELIACQSDRSVVRWHSEQLKTKFDRYQKIIAEATLQSKREFTMVMNRYLPLLEAMSLDFTHKYIATEIAHENRFNLMENPKIPHGAKVALIIGPEGGFSDGEYTAAFSHGYQPISLGITTLRTETAAIIALGILANQGES